MANKIGEVSVQINGDSSGLMKALADVKKNVKKSNETLDTMNASLKKIDATTKRTGDTFKSHHATVMENLVALSGALATLKIAFIDTMKAAKDFEYGLAKISTMLRDESKKLLPKYAEQIKKIAIEFGQGTDVVQEGLYNVLSAQVKATEAMKFLEVATKTATAGFTATDKTTSALLSVMKAYNMETKDAMKIADKLYMTVFKGRLTFESLADTIGNVVSTAANAGMGLDDFLASFATISRIVGKAKMSASAITGIMNALLKPSIQGKKVLDELGISFDAASVKIRGFIPILKELSEKLETPEQLSKIVGRIQGLRGITSMLRDIKGYASDVKDIANSSGTVDKHLDNVTQTLEVLRKRVTQVNEVLKATFGDLFLNELKQFMELLIKTGTSLINFTKEHKKMIKIVSTGIFTMGVGVSVLMGWKLLLPLIAKLGLKAAIGLAAMGGAGAGIRALTGDMESFFVILKKAYNVLKIFGKNLSDTISYYIELIFNASVVFKDIIFKIKALLFVIFEEILHKFANFGVKVLNRVTFIANLIKIVLLKAFKKLAPAIQKYVRKLPFMGNFKIDVSDIDEKVKKLDKENKEILYTKKNKPTNFASESLKYISDIAKERLKLKQKDLDNASEDLAISLTTFLEIARNFRKNLDKNAKDFKNLFVKTEPKEFKYRKKEEFKGSKLKSELRSWEETFTKLPDTFYGKLYEKKKKFAKELLQDISGKLIAKKMENTLFDATYGTIKYAKKLTEKALGKDIATKSLGKFKVKVKGVFSPDIKTSYKPFDKSLLKNLMGTGELSKLHTDAIRKEKFITYDPLTGDDELLKVRKQIREEVVMPIRNGLTTVAKTAKWTMKDFEASVSSGFSNAFNEFFKMAGGFKKAFSNLTKDIADTVLNTLRKMLADAAAEGLISLGKKLFNFAFPMPEKVSENLIQDVPLKNTSLENITFAAARKSILTDNTTVNAARKSIASINNNAPKILGSIQGNKPNIAVNVHNNSTAQVEQGDVDVSFDGRQYIINVVMEEANRNPNFKNAMR